MQLTNTLVAVAFLSSLAYAFTQQSSPDGQRPPQERFDLEVRADFFAGFAGDEARLARAMSRCEEALAVNPDHAQALVWHGAGLIWRAGIHFSNSDATLGLQLWSKGLSEMERAVNLAPDSAAVRIPRGASLLEASRYVPKEQQSQLLTLALGDYEHALKLQRAFFSKLSDHAKGELLFGLGEGWARAGNHQKARDYFMRLTKDASGSGRAAYANAWLDGRPPADPGRCAGCH